MLDLPGSAAVGRRIIAEQGMSDRVQHVEGDMMSADLGGPHDGALVLQHRAPPFAPSRTSRCCAACTTRSKPGGTVAVLDLWLPEGDRRPDAAAMLGLFFYLTSSAATYAEGDVRGG